MPFWVLTHVGRINHTLEGGGPEAPRPRELTLLGDNVRISPHAAEQRSDTLVADTARYHIKFPPLKIRPPSTQRGSPTFCSAVFFAPVHPCEPALRYSVDRSVYGTGSVKIGNTRRTISVDIRTDISLAQCLPTEWAGVVRCSCVDARRRHSD